MNPKLLGGVQIGGAILALILGFLDMTFYAMFLFAVIFVVMGIHHLTEKHEAV